MTNLKTRLTCIFVSGDKICKYRPHGNGHVCKRHLKWWTDNDKPEREPQSTDDVEYVITQPRAICAYGECKYRPHANGKVCKRHLKWWTDKNQSNDDESDDEDSEPIIYKKRSKRTVVPKKCRKRISKPVQRYEPVEMVEDDVDSSSEYDTELVVDEPESDDESEPDLEMKAYEHDSEFDPDDEDSSSDDGPDGDDTDNSSDGDEPEPTKRVSDTESDTDYDSSSDDEPEMVEICLKFDNDPTDALMPAMAQIIYGDDWETEMANGTTEQQDRCIETVRLTNIYNNANKGQLALQLAPDAVVNKQSDLKALVINEIEQAAVRMNEKRLNRRKQRSDFYKQLVERANIVHAQWQPNLNKLFSRVGAVVKKNLGKKNILNRVMRALKKMVGHYPLKQTVVNMIKKKTKKYEKIKDDETRQQQQQEIDSDLPEPNNQLVRVYTHRKWNPWVVSRGRKKSEWVCDMTDFLNTITHCRDVAQTIAEFTEPNMRVWAPWGGGNVWDEQLILSWYLWREGHKQTIKESVVSESQMGDELKQHPMRCMATYSERARCRQTTINYERFCHKHKDCLRYEMGDYGMGLRRWLDDIPHTDWADQGFKCSVHSCDVMIMSKEILFTYPLCNKHKQWMDHPSIVASEPEVIELCTPAAMDPSVPELIPGVVMIPESQLTTVQVTQEGLMAFLFSGFMGVNAPLQIVHKPTPYEIWRDEWPRDDDYEFYGDNDEYFDMCKVIEDLPAGTKLFWEKIRIAKENKQMNVCVVAQLILMVCKQAENEAEAKAEPRPPKDFEYNPEPEEKSTEVCVDVIEQLITKAVEQSEQCPINQNKISVDRFNEIWSQADQPIKGTLDDALATAWDPAKKEEEDRIKYLQTCKLNMMDPTHPAMKSLLYDPTPIRIGKPDMDKALKEAWIAHNTVEPDVWYTDGLRLFHLPDRIEVVKIKQPFVDCDVKDMRQKERFYGIGVPDTSVNKPVVISQQQIENNTVTISYYTRMPVRTTIPTDSPSVVKNLNNIRDMGALLNRYWIGATVPPQTTRIGFVIHLRNGTTPSTKFLDIGDAIRAAIELMATMDERYVGDDPDSDTFVTGIQLKTVSFPELFLGGEGVELQMDEYVQVHYKSKTNCVKMALLLGKLKHNKAQATWTKSYYKNGEVIRTEKVRGPILAAPVSIWHKRMNNENKRKIAPALRELGVENLKGVSREEMNVMAAIMKVRVQEYDEMGVWQASYGNKEHLEVMVVLGNGHCELILEKSILTEEELKRVSKGDRFMRLVAKCEPAKVYMDYMVADIEAYSQDEHMPYAIGSERASDGMEIYFRGERCIELWLDQLSEMKRPDTWDIRKPFVMPIWYHNGKKYDFYLLRNKLLDYEALEILANREICDGSRMIKFSVKNKNHVQFDFMDSYLVLKSSLSKLTKDLKVKHQKLCELFTFDQINEFIYERGFSDETIEALYKKFPMERYLRHDVKGLMEVMKEMIKTAKMFDVDMCKCPTVTSLAKRILKTNFMTERMHNLTDLEDEYIAPAVQGGNCGAYYIGEYHGIAFAYDVDGMYSSKCMKIEGQGEDGGLPARVRGGIVERYFKLDCPADYYREFGTVSDFFIRTWVMSDQYTPYPVHMVRIAPEGSGVKKNVNPHIEDKWRIMTIYGREILYALQEKQYKYKVVSYLEFETAPVFAAYMAAIYKMKKDAGRNKPALRLFAKLLLNSLTGAPGMNVNNRRGARLVPIGKAASEVEAVVQAGKMYDFNRVGKYVAIDQDSVLTKTFFNRAMYAAITSKGRIEKNRFENAVYKAGGRCLTGDTDSVLITIDAMKEPTLRRFFAPNRQTCKVPGYWINELAHDKDDEADHDFYTHVFIGPTKSYFMYNPALPRGKMNPHVACKSYQGDPIQRCYERYMRGQALGDDKHALQEIEKGMVFRGGYKVAMTDFQLRTVWTDRKTFKLNYDKAVVTLSGWTVPWVLKGDKLCYPDGYADKSSRAIAATRPDNWEPIEADDWELAWQARAIAEDFKAAGGQVEDLLTDSSIVMVVEQIRSDFKVTDEDNARKLTWKSIHDYVADQEEDEPTLEEAIASILEEQDELETFTKKDLRRELRYRRFDTHKLKQTIKDVLIPILDKEVLARTEQAGNTEIDDEPEEKEELKEDDDPEPEIVEEDYPLVEIVKCKPRKYYDKKNARYYSHLQIIGKAGWGAVIYDSILKVFLFRDHMAAKGWAQHMKYKWFFKYTNFLFGACPSAKYWEAMSTAVPNKHFYEWFNPDKPLKPVFDIDDEFTPKEEFEERWETVIRPWLKNRWKKVVGHELRDEDFTVSRAHGHKSTGWKNSLHVLINNGLYFKNAHDTKRWWLAFDTPDMPDGIDKGLYQYWRSFRMVGSTKVTNGTPRVLDGPVWYATDFQEGEMKTPIDCSKYPSTMKKKKCIATQSQYRKPQKDITDQLPERARLVCKANGWTAIKRASKYEFNNEVYQLDCSTVTCPFANKVHKNSWIRLILYPDRMEFKCKNGDNICDHRTNLIEEVESTPVFVPTPEPKQTTHKQMTEEDMQLAMQDDIENEQSDMDYQMQLMNEMEN